LRTKRRSSLYIILTTNIIAAAVVQFVIDLQRIGLSLDLFKSYAGNHFSNRTTPWCHADKTET